MSKALLPSAGLRWWNSNELAHRDLALGVLNNAIQGALRGINSAWQFHRVEAPMLIPQSMISSAYTPEDVFFTQREMMEQTMVMRPETTSGSYAAAYEMLDARGTKQLPMCVWQVGKSYRVEKSDGASASKLRYNEFTQAEWQCVYRADTQADYRAVVMPALRSAIGWLTGCQDRVVPSDRLPAYSQLTEDVEVMRPRSGALPAVVGVEGMYTWTEMCSVSTRTDFEYPKFQHPLLVLEVAVGLDRVVDVAVEAGVVQ